MSTLPIREFERAIDAALAPLDQPMGPRRRFEALSRARRELYAAAASTIEAERRA